MPTIFELTSNGQSVWIDTLSRSMLDNGQVQAYIDQGVRGVTANPTILDKAVTSGMDYDDDIRRMASEGKSPTEMYDGLVIPDIQRAADLFHPVYDLTGGGDGFVSLEVSPHLAYDTAGTINEVRRLFSALDRQNVFIKVPATPQGIPAVEQLISEGININITLMFSLAQYQAVAEAYITGLERLQRAGGDIRKVVSVASFFLSRIDTAVDKLLEEKNERDLQGHIAIASARLAYARFIGIFTSERWRSLADAGARIQRPLWASTGTKNPKYPDTMYVDNLIGPNTVNTMPLNTLQAFLDHGSVAPRIEFDLDSANYDIGKLAARDIDLTEVTDQLLEDGVNLFSTSFDHTMAYITEKSGEFGAQGRKAA